MASPSHIGLSWPLPSRIPKVRSVREALAPQGIVTVSKATPKPESGDAPGKKAKVVARSIPHGFVKYEMPADGACLFHSFAKGLKELAAPVSKLPLELRAIVVEHMTKYAKEYSLDWDGKHPDGKTQLENFDSYLKAVVSQDAFASSLEVKALARKFDAQVIVCSDAPSVDPVLFHKQGKRGAVVLWHSGGNHFDLLEGKSTCSASSTFGCASDVAIALLFANPLTRIPSARGDMRM